MPQRTIAELDAAILDAVKAYLALSRYKPNWEILWSVHAQGAALLWARYPELDRTQAKTAMWDLITARSDVG